MKRIEAEIEKAKGIAWDNGDPNRELGLAIRIAYKCTDHIKDHRYKVLLEAAFELISQDCGPDAAKQLFNVVADHG